MKTADEQAMKDDGIIITPSIRYHIDRISLNSFKAGGVFYARHKEVKHEPFEVCDLRKAILTDANNRTELP